MVKTRAADGTILETIWESRWLPDSKKKIIIRNIISIENGGVAQLGEHLPCKQGVKSSNLSVSTVKTLRLHGLITIQTDDTDHWGL